MKLKFKLLIVLLFFLLSAVSAYAAPYTWTDEINLGDRRLYQNAPMYTYTHDITDDGFSSYFMGGDDYILEYSLNVSLSDDGDNHKEAALISQSGDGHGRYYNFDYSDQEFGWSLAGWAELNLYGSLTVTIERMWGDFNLGYSTLTAIGDNGYDGVDVAPVPEPATLILMGIGLLGIAAGASRRKSKIG
jgi:hypothetical protein